jgi:hypothetical protein
MYRYHREGLDKMHEDAQAAREKVLMTLANLASFQQSQPNSILVRAFMDAKNTELMQVFQKAPVDQRQRFVAVMKQVDPTNYSVYESLLQER